MPNCGPSIPKIVCPQTRARQKRSSAEIECRQIASVPNRPCAREPAEIETLQDHSVEVPEMHHKVECHIARVPIRNLPKENRSRANNAFGPRHPPPDPADDTRPEPAHIARRAVVPQGKGQRRLSGL